MLDTLDTPPELTQLVRSALAHLYDYAYLQNHPLAFILDVERDLDKVTRAQKVRRVLLDCIEALRPQGHGDALSDAARAYAILTYRYVDGLSMEEIEEKLALSRRQVYREHAKGVEAVASVLWDRIREKRDRAFLSALAESTAEDRLKAAQAEVARLRETVHIEPLNPREVLEGVLALLNPRIQQTGIQLHLPAQTWPPVIADRIMLRQAFLNVLSYALDAASQKALIITGTAERRGLVVEICELPTAGSVPHPPLIKRAGVGLAVAQALIEAQGGRLETVEGGKPFRARILLPTAERPTILVVDDNAGLVALFQRYLGGHDVCVVGATSGEQALLLARELQPQVITLDVMMPHQDGWEILQKLQSSPDTRHIPVIVCSVLNERELALAMGASDYLVKPISQMELLATLRRWLGVLLPAG
ncbi:MAG: response regulator [Anaerolineae bacterium]|nr:response regulator [Anaerolineae bacterium]MDW8098639.1 response regulator [Anaerolineae bacterium]